MDGGGTIGRIGENHLERLPPVLELRKRARDVEGEDLDAVMETELRGVPADGLASAAVALDEDCGRSPAGEGLEAESTRAGVEVEDA